LDDIKRLRARVISNLRKQGFDVRKNEIIHTGATDKAVVRALHDKASATQLKLARSGLERLEDRLISRIANGQDLDVAAIRPALVRVTPGSFEERLFRYAYLHWSIPISRGYGRRLRYVVVDKGHNDALIGIIGLHDPVIALGPRDQWIGWDKDQRIESLHHVMDAYVLGAVAPYSKLLGGKLVALLATSREVQRDFRRMHGHRTTRIAKRTLDSHLALLTTTSALGRSSVYNRLKHRDRLAFVPVGMTAGSGDFHFSNGIYAALHDLVKQHGAAPRDRKAGWGKGFRNRREVVHAGLSLLGLPRKLRRHGVEREIFVVPLASNAREFLTGKHKRLKRFDASVNELFAWFRDRWLLRRARADEAWRAYSREEARLWPKRRR
jgi:hypothetical protein